MAAVVTWPRRLRLSPAISLSSFSSSSLLLTTYSISIRLPYNHVKDKKSCTLPNTKTRYTLDTSTKQWSGQDLIIRTQSTAIFLCIQPFSAWWQTITTKQPGDPRASLLLTSEKAVFCKIYSQSKHTYLPLWGTAPRSEQKHWDPTEFDRSGHRRRSQSLHL